MGLRLQFSQNIRMQPMCTPMQSMQSMLPGLQKDNKPKQEGLRYQYLVPCLRFHIHVQISVYGDHNQINVAISEISHGVS